MWISIYIYRLTVLAWDPVSLSLSSLSRKDKECSDYSALRDAGKILWDNTLTVAGLGQADVLHIRQLPVFAYSNNESCWLEGHKHTFTKASHLSIHSTRIQIICTKQRHTPPLCTQHALHSVLTWVFFIIADIASRWASLLHSYSLPSCWMSIWTLG